MFTVDVAALRGRMGAQKCSISKLARAAGVNRNTMTFYLEHPEKFPYPVMQKVANTLCMNVDEARRVFFTQELA